MGIRKGIRGKYNGLTVVYVHVYGRLSTTHLRHQGFIFEGI